MVENLYNAGVERCNTLRNGNYGKTLILTLILAYIGTSNSRPIFDSNSLLFAGVLESCRKKWMKMNGTASSNDEGIHTYTYIHTSSGDAFFYFPSFLGPTNRQL